MQNVENSKQSFNELLAKYRPLGPRHLLAAALMMHAGKDAKDAETKQKNAASAVAA
jgi:hypothetical protein